MTHIVFCSVPYIETTEPCMGPAVLKSVAERAGYTAVAMDMNLEVFNRMQNSPNKNKLNDFFFEEYMDDTIVGEVLDYIYLTADRILAEQPQIVGLSLLTYGCKIFTRWLCVHLRSVAPDLQIVVGGPGVRTFVKDDNDRWVDDLRATGLIDDYIIGDGEISVVEYLSGNRDYPGINNSNWQQLDNLDSFPHPDFSDYKFDQYEKPVIPVVESRGCVRTCEFCDIIEHWTKFRFRTAENVFNEIVAQAEKYNIRTISMRNSLTNGNMKVFKELVRLMANYNRARPAEQQLSWVGYFIIRNAGQHPEDFWPDLKDSNGTLLLGVESVIQSVRYQIGKKFDDADIDYHLEMGQKYQVPLRLLMIVAYPSETRADYEFTKQWFQDRVQYAGNSVYAVSLSIASVLPGTALERKKEEYGIEVGKFPAIWFNQQLGISNQEKVDYYNELVKLIDRLGFAVPTHSQKQTLKVMDDFA